MDFVVGFIVSLLSPWLFVLLVVALVLRVVLYGLGDFGLWCLFGWCFV